MRLQDILSTFVSGFAFLLTYLSIPEFAPLFIAAGLFGKDLSKRNKPKIPESLGLVCGTNYLIAMFINLGIFFIGNVSDRSKFPYVQFSEFLAAILCICCMLFLGFVDDVLNLKWRYKLILPTVASMPLLIVYYINGGETHISIPIFMQSTLGTSINIGPFYYIYMSLLAVFCTNAINIYAGVNGLESGQSVVIAISICIFNLIELLLSGVRRDAHMFSLSVMMPFVTAAAGLFCHNKYPAKVFVGDTFTYFAGMTFAVVGIIGHFSKTLLLFFIPQVFNFLYSAPQIFGIIPCPRHRIPNYDVETDLMQVSFVKFKKNSVNPWLYQILKILGRFHIIKLQELPENFVSINNLTLLNLVLLWLGPLKEKTLTNVLLGIQILGTFVAFFIRYYVANFFYCQVPNCYS